MVVDFYRPGTSFLHRFDPRAKLILLVPITAGFLLPAPLAVSAAFAALIAVVIALAFGTAELGVPLRSILPVLILIALLTPPFHPQGRVFLRVFSFPLVTSEGLRVTGVMLLRFAGISLTFFAAFRSIALDDLMLALRWFGIPFPACLVVIIAFRSLPSLSLTYRSVQDAHRLRAAAPSTDSRRGRGRLAGVLPILTSVLIQSVKGIPILAMVLESRGFGRANPRSSLSELKGGRALTLDLVLCAGASLVFLGAAIYPWH
jgi:energy-coupling factor transport system permease protein